MIFVRALGCFFFGGVGFGKEQVIRCSFFVRGGDVCGAVVWQPSDWMENHFQAVLHTKVFQKNAFKKSSILQFTKVAMQFTSTIYYL